jgi:hypothetical protein
MIDNPGLRPSPPTSKYPSERKEAAQNAIIPAIRVCSCGCGKSFKPKRRWHHFYSAKCRKTVWTIKHSEQTPADIRATLNRIEIKLDQAIELKLKI